jgi:hypothetical protein
MLFVYEVTASQVLLLLVRMCLLSLSYRLQTQARQTHHFTNIQTQAQATPVHIAALLPLEWMVKMSWLWTHIRLFQRIGKKKSVELVVHTSHRRCSGRNTNSQVVTGGVYQQFGTSCCVIYCIRSPLVQHQFGTFCCVIYFIRSLLIQHQLPVHIAIHIRVILIQHLLLHVHIGLEFSENTQAVPKSNV